MAKGTGKKSCKPASKRWGDRLTVHTDISETDKNQTYSTNMTFQQNIGVRTDEKDEDKVPLLQKQSETFHGNKSNYTNISEV